MDYLRNGYWNLQPKKRSKIGWIETHYHQKELLRKSYASVVMIGDSIVAVLRRYPKVWGNFILQYKPVNLDICGDRTENVLWRIKDIVLQKSIRSVVIHCGTNNIHTSSSDEISVGVVTIARSISIVTQISRSFLVAFYEEKFIGLCEELKLMRPMIIWETIAKKLKKKTFMCQ